MTSTQRLQWASKRDTSRPRPCLDGIVFIHRTLLASYLSISHGACAAVVASIAQATALMPASCLEPCSHDNCMRACVCLCDYRVSVFADVVLKKGAGKVLSYCLLAYTVCLADRNYGMCIHARCVKTANVTCSRLHIAGCSMHIGLV
jgi:hypothetical protein